MATRRSLSNEQQIEPSEAVADRVVEQLDTVGLHPKEGQPVWPKPFVGAYRPLQGELDPTPAVYALRERGWGVALPRCGEDGHMDFCSWKKDDYLHPGAYGILEPMTPPIDLSLLAAVIVPGVGFDRSGNRIGHGVGFYDRFFARSAQHGYDPYRLGLAYDFQIVDLPAPEPWDVPVHCVITPSELIGS